MVENEIMFVLGQRTIQSICNLKPKYLESLSIALTIEDFINEAQIKKK